MSNQPNEFDDELLALLESDDPATSREQWMDALGKIRDVATEDAPSDSFNASLRHRWKSELTANQPLAPSPAKALRHPLRLLLPLAAAAVLAMVFLWPGSGLDRSGNGSPSSVAWADVVKAMQRVEHFHLLAFDDDPRGPDEKQKLMRLDVFFQKPGRWRAQGLGHVSFVSQGAKPQTWSVEKKAWLDKAAKDERVPDLLPSQFIAQHEKLGTLGAVLAFIFDGKVPQGQPVKSDAVSTAQGIDVFDYAANATERWVRIWVLRESKLPLKMHMYYPGSDEFLLITFDYSDPQPDKFFDPKAFATDAAKVDTSSTQRVYGIGSSPVAGTRPRTSDQIHTVAGGYRAPKVKRIVSNAAGDVIVVTDNPPNTTPSGRGPLEQGYHKVTDNWGNEFISAGGSWGFEEKSDHRWAFMPLPPVKKGTVPRKLTMTFVIEPEHEQREELKTESLDVPDPSIAGKKDDWSEDFEQDKRDVYRGYLQRNGTLAQQLDEIRKRLAADANDVSALIWKFNLLREHGREDAAWALFESNLRDRVFADPKQLSIHYAEAAAYLLYLASQDRIDDVRKLSQSVGRMIESLQAKNDPRTRSELNMLFNKEHNPLFPAIAMLDWREQLKDEPKILRTLASKDGFVFIELQIPKPPESWRSNGWDGEAPSGWFWQPQPSKGWRESARFVQKDTGKLWVAYRGGEKQLPLSAEVALAMDNYGSKPKRHDFNMKWQRNIDVPAPSIEKMSDWWAKETGGKGRWYGVTDAQAKQPATMPAEQWRIDADKARDDGRFAEAIDLYAKALAAPKEQWPAWYSTARAPDPDLLEGQKRKMRISQAKCFAELGRFDEARKIAADIRAALPATLDLADPAQGYVAADALSAELPIPRVLFKRGDIKAAADELSRIAKHRPILKNLPTGMVMVKRGTGSYGWYPLGLQEDVWREYDSLWWDVLDALK
jgi:tetratricopeptide (TPR) repeat protein